MGGERGGHATNVKHETLAGHTYLKIKNYSSDTQYCMTAYSQQHDVAVTLVVNYPRKAISCSSSRNHLISHLIKCGIQIY